MLGQCQLFMFFGHQIENGMELLKSNLSFLLKIIQALEVLENNNREIPTVIENQTLVIVVTRMKTFMLVKVIKMIIMVKLRQLY